MDVRDTIINVISDTLKVPRADVHDTSKLVDIAKDSILLFELLIELEKTFHHHVKYDDIAHIETVGDVIAYINSLSITPEMLVALEKPTA